MLKKICPLFLLPVFFTACAGGPISLFMSNKSQLNLNNSLEQPFFSSLPSDNNLIFIGAAGKRSNPNDTIQFALEDAARQVAFFDRVSGEYATENNIGSGAFDYTAGTSTSPLQYNEAGVEQYIDALQYDADDAIEMENALFIRTTYPSALPFPVNYRPRYIGEDKKPDWVDDPPSEIEGYEVGVGFSGRRSSIADTYANSRNNAVFSIIRKMNAVVRSSDFLYENTSSLFGYKTSNDNVIYSFGTLTGFYVLDTWIDPKEKTVWTLAIALKSG